MKSLTRIYAMAVGSIAFILAACGDTVENVNQMGMDVVASEDDLPKCAKDNEGEMAFVMDAGTTLICVDGDWVPSVNGEGADFSCKTVELEDKSGLKIVCNGDSIGVVLNGEKGESGKDGNDGASGSGCSITDRNDTAVVVVCGDSTMTISLGVGQSGDSLEGDLDREPISLDSLAGYTQKGPFLKGSTVYLYELSDGRTLKQTNGNFTSSISSDDGRYKFSARDLVSQYAMVVVDGYYRNEVTGATSDATIRLKAITDMRKRSSVNVNLLTHMEYDRVYNLVTKEHKTVKKAKQQAQEEILNLFHIKLDGKADAEDMDVFGKTDADAALLAISVVLQGDRSEADLASLLAAFAADLADNGVWDNLRDRAQIADWAMKKTFSAEGLAAIRANVEGWGLGDGKAPAFEGMVTNFWETELKLGACSNDNAGSIKAIGNKYSSYYAKSDSLASEGDSSDVRLICAADGDSYAWRYATDIEKNTAPFTDVSEGLAKYGAVNTQNVYVYEDSKWRRGIDLDMELNFSCIAGREGKMDSKTSKTGTTWYTCDTDPVVWREATAEEADTAGFGVPTGEDPIVRIGNVDKSHVYVYEKGWRYGTDLDLDKGLGPCVIDTMNHVRQLSGTTGSRGWYTCAESEASVEGNRIPRAWRKATDFERDTYQWLETDNGTLRISELSGLKYVYDNNRWRPATDMEKLGLGACTMAQRDSVKPSNAGSSESWYKCTNEYSTIVDTFNVEFTWRKAIDIEKDTVGYGYGFDVVKPSADSVKIGFVNKNYVYVYENGAYRIGTGLDYSLGLGGCTGNRARYTQGASIGTLSQTAGGVYYMCATADTMVNGYKVTSAWRPATDTEVDTYGWEKMYWSTCRMAESNIYYVHEYPGQYWRPTKKLECANGLEACGIESYGRLAKNADDDVFRCEETGWEPGSQFDVDTYGFQVGISNTCISSETGEHMVYSTGINGGDYDIAQLVPGQNDSTHLYVCDDKKARRATALEVFVGKGCTVYNKDEFYATQTTDYKCNGSRWNVVKGVLNTGRPGEQAYKTVRIGESVWMAENLNYRYINPTQTLDSSSYCYEEDCEKYGRLYLLSAVLDSAGAILPNGVGKGCGRGVVCDDISNETIVQGICPEGWHVPRYAEADYLIALSEHGTDFLDSTRGSDRYGFSLMIVAEGGEEEDGVVSFWNTGNGVYLATSSLPVWTQEYVSAIRFYYDNSTYQNSIENRFPGRYELSALRCIRDKLASEEPYR